MKTLLNIVAFASVIILSISCSTVGYKKANNTSSSLQITAQSIDSALLPLDAVLVSLRDLARNSGENITSQFKSYSAAVSDLESSFRAVTANAVEMQKQGDAYFENWEQELAKIQNNDIQSRSRDRKISVSKHFQKVREDYGQTSRDFAPFMSNLIDIRTALASDLTSGGVSSFKSQLTRANKEASSLRDSLVDLSNDFKEFGVSLSPGNQLGTTGK